MDKNEVFVDIMDLVSDLREDGHEFNNIRKMIEQAIGQAIIEISAEEDEDINEDDI